MQEKIGFASGHRDATQTNRTSILPTPNSLSCFYCCVHFFYFSPIGLHFALCLGNMCSHTGEFLFPGQAVNFLLLLTKQGYCNFVKLYSLRCF